MTFSKGPCVKDLIPNTWCYWEQKPLAGTGAAGGRVFECGAEFPCSLSLLRCCCEVQSFAPKLGTVAHTCNPSNQRFKQEDYELEARQGYTVRACLSHTQGSLVPPHTLCLTLLDHRDPEAMKLLQGQKAKTTSKANLSF